MREWYSGWVELLPTFGGGHEVHEKKQKETQRKFKEK